MTDQYIKDFYYSDIEELDYIYNLKNGESLSDTSLLEKMKKEPNFDIFTEILNYQIVGYDKIFNRENNITVEDIKELIKLGFLTDDLKLVNN